jgi:hypothetical protein
MESKVIAIVFLFFYCCDAHLKINQQILLGSSKTWFYETQVTADYEASKAWCRQLGGQLPIIHTIDDLNFLKNVVLGNPGSDFGKTWLGLEKQQNCSTWNDGTPLNITVNWVSSDICQSCFGPCCAMYLQHQGKMGIIHCTHSARMVCVLDGSSMDPIKMTEKLTDTENKMNQLQKETRETFTDAENELRKALVELKKLQIAVTDHETMMVNLTDAHDKDIKAEMKKLKTSTKSSNVLLWVNLTLMITLMITMGVIGYFGRNKYPNTSVAYVSNQDTLDFSSQRLTDTSRKANNLYPERDQCGGN